MPLLTAEETESTADALPPLTLNHLFVPLLCVFSATAYAYRDVMKHLAQDWIRDPNYSHGIFIPIFAVCVLWNRRALLAKDEVNGTWWGLALCAVSIFLFLFATLGAELFVARISLILLLAGIAITFTGVAYFRHFFFPWAVLFLMVPLPSIIFNEIMFPLQITASKMAALLLSVFGVPVLRDGNLLQLPTITLEVAEACSGIRSLVSLTALAVMYAYLQRRSRIHMVLLVLFAVPIAVVANALRILVTGLVAHYWEPEAAEGFFHSFEGWLLFVFSVALLIGVDQVLRVALRKHEVSHG